METGIISMRFKHYLDFFMRNNKYIFEPTYSVRSFREPLKFWDLGQTLPNALRAVYEPL